jgi:hypothetical protein
MARFNVIVEGMGDFPLNDRGIAERCFEHYSTSVIEGITYPGNKEVTLKDMSINKTLKHFIPTPQPSIEVKEQEPKCLCALDPIEHGHSYGCPSIEVKA